jgi:hypothetical protein
MCALHPPATSCYFTFTCFGGIRETGPDRLHSAFSNPVLERLGIWDGQHEAHFVQRGPIGLTVSRCSNGRVGVLFARRSADSQWARWPAPVLASGRAAPELSSKPCEQRKLIKTLLLGSIYLESISHRRTADVYRTHRIDPFLALT